MGNIKDAKSKNIKWKRDKTYSFYAKRKIWLREKIGLWITYEQ